ncbi:methyltransferase domain-containing protein [Cellulosimicrobium terreum]|nr:methyltransferase domain-containing protein [Cellulosimicrobium terreum]
MATTDLIREHYSEADLADRILRQVAAVDGEAVSVEALAPYDQLHAGGSAATVHLLDQLDLGPGTALLDVGCGFGGPARLAASRHGCPVTGVDLSPDFVDAARTLAERAGLSDLLAFAVGESGHLPCDDDSQDRAMLVHVGMNVEDKSALFAEVRRALRPGGLFGVYDQMRIGPGDLPFPLPWAVDAHTSFVEPVAAYTDGLEAAGFEVLSVEDRRRALAESGDPRQEGLVVVFGPQFAERIANNLAATRGGVLAPVLVLARA